MWITFRNQNKINIDGHIKWFINRASITVEATSNENTINLIQIVVKLTTDSSDLAKSGNIVLGGSTHYLQ